MKYIFATLGIILEICALAQFVASATNGWDAGRMALGLIFFIVGTLSIAVSYASSSL